MAEGLVHYSDVVCEGKGKSFCLVFRVSARTM